MYYAVETGQRIDPLGARVDRPDNDAPSFATRSCSRGKTPAKARKMRVTLGPTPDVL